MHIFHTLHGDTTYLLHPGGPGPNFEGPKPAVNQIPRVPLHVQVSSRTRRRPRTRRERDQLDETKLSHDNFVVSRETKGAPTLPSTLSSPQQGPGGLGQAETPAVANADVGTK